MTDSTPDPLWDGRGADAELEELQALLATYRAPSELPPLPDRGASSRSAWILALAAALLLAVGGAVVFGPRQQAEGPGHGALPGGRGTTGSAVDDDAGSGATGRSSKQGPADSSEAPGAQGARPSSSSPDASAPDTPSPGSDGSLRSDGDALGALTGDARQPLRSAGDTFIFYEDSMASSANPAHERSMSDVRLNELLHLALYAPNYADQPKGVLVRDAELDATGRVLTLTLRDMKWSDGEPVVADDVVFTLRTYKDPATGSRDRHRWDFIVRAEAPDPQTVVLHLARSYREVPASQLYLKVLPEHAFTGGEVKYGHRYRTQPVTAGPFIVTEKDHKNWILKRNPRGSRAAKLVEVRAQQVPEKHTQAQLMSYEYGHAMIEVTPQQRAELDADPCCTLKPYPSKSWWYVGMNQRDPRLADPHVRAALNLVLDRQQALDLIGEGELISGPFTLSSRYYDHSVSVPTPNQSAATAQMVLAGYKRAHGEWSKDGEPLAVRFVYDEGLGEQGQTVATNLAGQLKAFGVQVSQPVAVGGDTWEKRVLTKRDFDLVLGTWSFDVNEDIGQLFATGGVRNFVGHEDPRLDQLLRGAHASQDPSEQQAYMREAHRRLAETHPYLFLWSLRNFSALSWDVQGAHLQAFYYFTQLPDWSLAEQEP